MAQHEVNLFDLTLGVFKKHIDTEHHNHVAFALWALHTHVYQRFEYTPRLSLQSPTQESGKSEVLKLLRFITPNSKELFVPTVATLFRMAGNKTLLIDEVDNVPIRGDILSILNKGHEKGGMVPRVVKNVVVEWPVFGPIAFGGIGTLPSTLGSRSIVVPMYRQDPNSKIIRLDLNNMEHMQDLAFIQEIAGEWAEKAKLNLDPAMPDGFKGRKGNKWRILFAIADNLGRGDIARDAAAKFANTDAHPAELMLIDARKVFDRGNKPRALSNTELVDGMLRLEDFEFDWSTYKGRTLTPGLLAMALKPFGIQPRHVWLPEGRPRILQRLHRTYLKADFEEMWRRYGVPYQGVTGVTSVTEEETVVPLKQKKSKGKKKSKFKVVRS